MILFKACARCGGDVDATFMDDVYCVQCAFRPPVRLPGSRPADAMPSVASRVRDAELIDLPELSRQFCPRCGSEKVTELDKIEAQYNTCFRCNDCTHVFSPLGIDDELESQASR